MRQCLYAIGYEDLDFSVFFRMLRDAVGLFPFIFPEETFYWHVVMLTKGEYDAYKPYWNIGGTPGWDSISQAFWPSVRNFTSGRGASGIWLLGRLDGEAARPGHATLKQTDLMPENFWHEMSHFLGCDVGPSADYITIHSDRMYHCGETYPVAGNCTQLHGSGKGLCIGTMCVRCRVYASRFMGLKTNYRQSMAEKQWLESTFPRPYPCWYNADMYGQMDKVSGYDYDKYPLTYWNWEHDLKWYYQQPIVERTGKVHIVFDRVIGGDGNMPDVFTGNHPHYVFDPYDLTVKEEGFLSVEPDPAVRGDNAVLTALDSAANPISAVSVYRNGSLIGTTDAEGRLQFTV